MHDVDVSFPLIKKNEDLSAYLLLNGIYTDSLFASSEIDFEKLFNDINREGHYVIDDLLEEFNEFPVEGDELSSFTAMA